MFAEPDSGSEMLEQRRFTVSGISAKDHKSHSSPSGIAQQCFLHCSFHIGLGSEFRVQASCFAVSPTANPRRIAVGSMEPFHALLAHSIRKPAAMVLTDGGV